MSEDEEIRNFLITEGLKRQTWHTNVLSTFLAAWQAQTNIDPTDAVLWFQFNRDDGSVGYTIERKDGEIQKIIDNNTKLAAYYAKLIDAAQQKIAELGLDINFEEETKKLFNCTTAADCSKL